MPKGQETWLTPYEQVWKAEMGGAPAYKAMAKFLKPLHDLYGTEKVCRAFGIYLRDAGKYASVARFSQTIKLWLPTQEERWCVNHPQLGMYGIRDGKALCLDCWNGENGGDAA